MRVESIAVLLFSDEAPETLPGGSCLHEALRGALRLNIWLREDDFENVDLLVIPTALSNDETALELAARAVPFARYVLMECQFSAAFLPLLAASHAHQ